METSPGTTLGRGSRTGSLRWSWRRVSRLALLALLWASLEAYGRWSRNDLFDLLGAAPLVVLVSGLIQQLDPAVRVDLKRKGRTALGRFKSWIDFHIGLDLRGEPALPIRRPWRNDTVVAGLAVVALALGLGFSSLPGGLRSGLQQISGVLAVGFTASVWALMLVTLLFSITVAVALVGEAAGTASERTRVRLRYAAGVFLVALGFAPGALLLGALISCAALYTIAIGWVTRSLRLVWYPSPNLGPAWTTTSAIGSGLLLGVPLSVASIGALGAGPALFGRFDPEVLWTQWLGRTGFGAASGLVIGIYLYQAVGALRAKRADPAREASDPSRSIGARDEFLGASESLHELARERKYERGCGFLFAPHLWFLDGLSRDVEEETQFIDRIGPLYRTHYSRAARASFYALSREIGIDLLFVEDGVKPQAFREVLERLYSFHEAHPGLELSETHQIRPPRGIALLIQGYDFTTPWTIRSRNSTRSCARGCCTCFASAAARRTWLRQATRERGNRCLRDRSVNTVPHGGLRARPQTRELPA